MHGLSSVIERRPFVLRVLVHSPPSPNCVPKGMLVTWQPTERLLLSSNIEVTPSQFLNGMNKPYHTGNKTLEVWKSMCSV